MKKRSVSVLDLAREESRANIQKNILISERKRLLKRRNINLGKLRNNSIKRNILSVKRHKLSKGKVVYPRTSVNDSVLHVAREHVTKTINDNITKSEFFCVLRRKNKVLHRDSV